MNAIDKLIKETCKSDIYDQGNFEDAIKEMASIEATIQALLEVALDLQNLLSSLIVLRVEPILLPEEEKTEIVNKSESPFQEIIYSMFNIGHVNIYSISGALGEAFAEFKTRTAEIAGIYASHDFSRESQAILPKLIGIKAKEGVEDKSRDTFHSIEAQEKKVAAYDKVEPLFTDLKKSALMIYELETICDNIVKISTEKESLPPAITKILPGQKKVASGGYEVYSDISAVSNYVKDFSELIDNTSNLLYTKILEAEKITDVTTLVDTSDSIRNISEISEKISTAFHTKVREAYETTEVQTPKNISINGSLPAVSTKSEPHPVIYHDQQMIEIPAFMPDIKVPAAAINAAKLSNVISKESNSEKITMPFFKEALSGSHAISSSLLILPEPVSNAFESISNYITMASEINNQMSKVTELGGQVASETIAPFDLLLTGNDARAVHNPEVFGGISALEGQGMNIAKSIATTRELQKVGYSVINDITAAAPSGGTVYSGPQAMPRTMESIMQIISGSRSGPAPTSHTGSNGVNVHNTFNIMVDVKGGKDETELRDLGKKIGLILSEEIKRYGGTR